MSFLAISARFSQILVEEKASLEAAIKTLMAGTDSGEHYALGIYHPEANKVWLIGNGAAGTSESSRLAAIRKELKLERDFSSFEYLPWENLDDE